LIVFELAITVGVTYWDHGYIISRIKVVLASPFSLSWPHLLEKESIRKR
jgi:hypothetical protein